MSIRTEGRCFLPSDQRCYALLLSGAVRRSEAIGAPPSFLIGRTRSVHTAERVPKERMHSNRKIARRLAVMPFEMAASWVTFAVAVLQ